MRLQNERFGPLSSQSATESLPGSVRNDFGSAIDTEPLGIHRQMIVRMFGPVAIPMALDPCCTTRICLIDMFGSRSLIEIVASHRTSDQCWPRCVAKDMQS